MSYIHLSHSQVEKLVIYFRIIENIKLETIPMEPDSELKGGIIQSEVGYDKSSKNLKEVN